MSTVDENLFKRKLLDHDDEKEKAKVKVIPPSKPKIESINKEASNSSVEGSDNNYGSSGDDSDEEMPKSKQSNVGHPRITSNTFKTLKSAFKRNTTTSTVSFKNGLPQNLNDIERLESPLYRVSTHNVKKRVSKHAVGAEDSKDDSKTEITTVQNTLEQSFNSNVHTILQIINCIIRYTIVQFPFCFRVLGLIFGSGIISLVALMSMYTMYLVVKIYNAKQLNSFSLYAYEWWGMKGKIMILFLNMLGAFGSCLSYIIISLKIVPSLCVTFFGSDNLLSTKMFWSIATFVILVVYSLKKDVSGIKSAAVVGIFAIFAFLSLIVFDLLYSSWREVMPYEFPLNFIHISVNYDFFSCIACIILSFAFHPYTFSIYECLEKKTTRNMMITSSIGIFISLFIYLLIGAIGYIMYGVILSDSLLDSMKTDTNSPLLILENIAFVLNVIMSFPITFAVLKNYIFFAVSLLLTELRDMGKKVKDVIHKIGSTNNHSSVYSKTPLDVIEEADLEDSDFKETAKNKEDNEIKKDDNTHNAHDQGKLDYHQDQEGEGEDHSHSGHDHHDLVPLPQWAQSLLSVLVVLLIIYIANEYSSIKTIFSFLGATYANINAFILPSLFYLKFASDGKFWKNFLPYTFIFVGVIGLITCVTSNILSIIHGTPH